MRGKGKIWCFILGILLTVITVGIFTGCGTSSSVTIKMPSEVASTSEEETSKTDVDVYWDATYSMQGYTTLSEGNFYRTMPDMLGDIGDSMGEVKFFRFGQDIKPMEGREYRKFSDASAYDETVTAFHNVIEQADPNHVSVVVTDLFESDSDWSNVTKKLKEKYFSKHLAVAVIGIKNPFKGEIFDVGLNAAKYEYNSGNDPKKYRPFYLFIMGPENKVADFMSRWKERQDSNNETEYLLLSENLTEQAKNDTKLFLEDENTQNVYIDEKLGIKDRRIQEIGITDKGKDVQIATDFDYKPLFGSCLLDMNALKTSVDVMTLENEEWQHYDNPDQDAKVSFKKKDGADNSYEMIVKFNPENTLKSGEINFIHVSVAPEPKGYQIPDWIKQWNMANIDVSPDQFDGSKTVNLLHIIESLKDSVFASAHPSLANINLVVDLH